MDGVPETQRGFKLKRGGKPEGPRLGMANRFKLNLVVTKIATPTLS